MMVKVYIAQMSPELGNKEKNLNKIHQFIKKGASENADLILFPELALTGISTGSKTLELAEKINGPSINKIKHYAKKYNIKVIIGFPELLNNQVFNSASLINNDGYVIGTHRKVHLWDEETKHYTNGNKFEVWDTDAGKIGIMICYDTQFPESARILALKGAEMILVPTGNMSPFEDLQPFNIRSRAEENHVFVINSNLLAKEQDIYLFGESTASDPYGNILVKADQSETGLSVKVDFEKIATIKKQYNYLTDRRPDLYKDLLKNISL